MSFRQADARFALPRKVGSAAVLGDLPGWRDGLAQAGLELVPAGEAELVVAAGERAADALSLRPQHLILEGGRPARLLRASGWSPLELLPLPDVVRPELLLPAGEAAPVRHAIRQWRPGTSPRTRARNLLARELVARGIVPPGRRMLTAASHSGGDPFFVAAARKALSLEPAGWFAAFGRWAQPISRGAFFLFRDGEPAPAWVLKFARIPGLGELFDRDERGLRLAERSAPVVAAYAPRLLGRLEVEGLHASVETAARGETLGAVLDSSRSLSDRVAAVEVVAAWLLRLAEETAAPPEALETERRRLEAEVVPRWKTEGLPQTLVADLPPTPAVFQHGDVFGDNVVLGPRGRFTVLDWESAREHGLPLWDLFYFLTRAIGALDEVRSEDEREEHFVRLWRGELESSKLLFHWTRRAVEAIGVPPQAVGRLATLLWLSYGLLDADEAARVAEIEGAPPSSTAPATLRFARRWLSEPGLGPNWDRWR